MNDPFWLNDPAILIRKLDVLPNQQMTNAERLNALTRLLLIVTLILFIAGYDHALTIFVLGIILILVLRTNEPKQKEGFQPHRGNHIYNCGFDSSMPHINTKYETSPIQQYNHLNYGLRSYTNAKYKLIPIETPAPYREIWQNEPNYYNEFSQYPESYDVDYYPTPRQHFASQEYVERTPQFSANAYARQSAMPAVESAFMRDSTEYRNNVMGEIVDFYEKQRQHNCVGYKPGRKTF